jgi:YVTN family beta-propeller protein
MRLNSLVVLILILVSSCKKETQPLTAISTLENGMLVLCEGLFQQNNSSLSWINLQNEEVDVDFFNTKNGRLLGDTGNDMHVYGGKIYIVVNNSNTLEILSKSSGESIKQLAMTVNGNGKQPRSIAFHGSKAFITCYDGYVDILDTLTLTITNRIKVGANPEGLAVSNGKLFVANSGGLNVSLPDSTVSIIDLSTFQEIKKITVGKNPGHINVDEQGDVYVIARGNYGSIPSRMVKIDPITNTVSQTFSFDASKIERMNDHFLISFYNYSTETSEIRLFNTVTENIVSNSFISTNDITTLYGIYYNSTSDKIFCLDAMSYTNSGYVRQYNSSGIFEKSYHVGLNPSKIIFYQ